MNFSIFSEEADSVELLLFDRHDDKIPTLVLSTRRENELTQIGSIEDSLKSEKFHETAVSFLWIFETEPTEKDELVLTSAGWLPKSKVHNVEPDQHVEVENGKLKIIDTAIGKTIEELVEIRESGTTRQRNVPVEGHAEKKKRPKKEWSLYSRAH